MILLRMSCFIKWHCVCEEKIIDGPLNEDPKWTHSGWTSSQIKPFTLICLVFESCVYVMKVKRNLNPHETEAHLLNRLELSHQYEINMETLSADHFASVLKYIFSVWLESITWCQFCLKETYEQTTAIILKGRPQGLAPFKWKPWTM